MYHRHHFGEASNHDIMVENQSNPTAHSFLLTCFTPGPNNVVVVVGVVCLLALVSRGKSYVRGPQRQPNVPTLDLIAHHIKQRQRNTLTPPTNNTRDP
jgi:hypothetical protein